MFSTIHDFAEMLHTTYLNIQYVLCMISQTHEHDKFFAFLIILPTGYSFSYSYRLRQCYFTFKFLWDFNYCKPKKMKKLSELTEKKEKILDKTEQVEV